MGAERFKGNERVAFPAVFARFADESVPTHDSRPPSHEPAPIPTPTAHEPHVLRSGRLLGVRTNPTIEHVAFSTAQASRLTPRRVFIQQEPSPSLTGTILPVHMRIAAPLSGMMLCKHALCGGFTQSSSPNGAIFDGFFGGVERDSRKV